MTRKALLAASAAVLLTACTSPALFPSDAMDRATFERELERNFQYPPPQPIPGETSDLAVGQRADAIYFRQFPSYDRSYTPAARAQAQRLADELSKDAARISHEQLVMRIAAIAALADNGHTAIDQNALMKNTPRVPLRTYLFDDGLFVLRTDAAHADLLGARIDFIEGHPIRQVFSTLRSYAGGISARRDRYVLPVLESPGLLKAASLANEPHALTYSGITATGQPFQTRVEAEDRGPAAPVMNSARLLYPAGPNATLRSFASDGAARPLYLTHDSELFWMQPLGRNGLYVDVTFNNDTDDSSLQDFLGHALDQVRTTHPDFVVVDMRMNGGGDYTKSYAFARSLPKTEVKRIYVLTSPFTFSAAITTVAALKDSGGAKVLLVGQPVGDRLDFWAEGGSFFLLNSAIRVYYTAGRHRYDGPCNDPSECFWLNRRYPVRVGSLRPDIPAPLTFAAYREGRDPALDAVMAREAAK